MSIPTIEGFNEKSNISLPHKEDTIEPSYRVSSSRNYSESNDNKINHRFSLPTYSLNITTPNTTSYPNKNYFLNELNSLRSELNSNIDKLQKEFEQRIFVSFNEPLENSEQNNKTIIHDKQLWRKLVEVQSEINILKSKLNSNSIFNKNLELKINEILLFNEKQEAKINKLMQNNEITNNMQNNVNYNEWFSNLNLINTQYSNLLLKMSEIQKKENNLVQSLNKININENTIDANMKRIANKVKENANDIKELKLIIMNNSNVEVNKPQDSNNNQNDINYTPLNIDYKFQSMKDLLLSEISSLKEENVLLKNELTKFESKCNLNINNLTEKYNNELNLIKNENQKLKQLLISKNKNDKPINYDNNSINNNSNKDFYQFKIDQEEINEKNQQKLNSLEEKVLVTEQKIEIMNEINKTNFQKNEEKLNEINQILPIIPLNEKNIQIVYENMQNLEENNKNIKQDIKNYKNEISKWQGELADHFDGQFNNFKDIYSKKIDGIEDYVNAKHGEKEPLYENKPNYNYSDNNSNKDIFNDTGNLFE